MAIRRFFRLNLTKWTGDTSNASVSGGQLTYYNGSGWKKMYSVNSFAPNVAYRARSQQTGQDSQSGFEKNPCCAGRDIIYYKALSTANDDYSHSQTSADFWNFSTWYIFDLLHKSGVSVKAYLNDALQVTNSTYVGTIAQPVCAGSAGATLYMDWVLVRKYVDPEPAHGGWGSEDVLVTQAGSATNWSWKVPAVDATEKVRSGSATNWSWVTFQNDGTGLTIPRGTATSWQWGP